MSRFASTVERRKRIKKHHDAKQMFNYVFPHYLPSPFSCRQTLWTMRCWIRMSATLFTATSPRVVHDSASCPQDRRINNERKKKPRRMLPCRLHTMKASLPTPIQMNHRADEREINPFWKKKKLISDICAGLKMTSLSDMRAEMSGCHLAWETDYRLLPHAKILKCALMIMEQSTPHTTLWASNSPGKHTCCGELWVSWVPSPRRPFKTWADTRQ